MSGFFDRMLGRGNQPKGSSSTAKDRLKFVLVHDRMEVAPEKLKAMREEILAVIAKYVPDIDPESVDISFEQSDRYNNKLIAQIPFTKPRGRLSDDVDGDDDFAFEASTMIDDGDDFAFDDETEADASDAVVAVDTTPEVSDADTSDASADDDVAAGDDIPDSDTDDTETA